MFVFLSLFSLFFIWKGAGAGEKNTARALGTEPVTVWKKPIIIIEVKFYIMDLL